MNPEWNKQQTFRRRTFLLGLADQLVKPHMIHRLETQDLHSTVAEAMKDCGGRQHIPPPAEVAAEERSSLS